jgi:hypothetical protein
VLQLASGLWRGREILKGARYDRVARRRQAPTASGPWTACPSQTQAKPSATASLWQDYQRSGSRVLVGDGRPDRTRQGWQVKDANGSRAAGQQGSSCYSLLPVVIQARRPRLCSAYQSPRKSTLGQRWANTGPRANLVRTSSPGKTGVIIMAICKRRP